MDFFSEARRLTLPMAPCEQRIARTAHGPLLNLTIRFCFAGRMLRIPARQEQLSHGKRTSQSAHSTHLLNADNTCTSRAPLSWETDVPERALHPSVEC